MDDFEKHYRAGLDDGMRVGIAMGRFYEKHHITDKIPTELADEFNAIMDEALKKVHGVTGYEQ